MPRSQKILILLCANVLLLLFALAAVEVGLRVTGYPFGVRWTPGETTIGRFDSELGWSYRPDLTTTLEVEGRTIEYAFDAEGIRVPTADTKLDPERPSILFIGGSFTMGHRLPYDETFAAQLGRRLDDRYQIVNLGVQAFGTDQALLNLRRHGPRFKPKLIVYTFISGHYNRNANRDRRMLFPGARFLGTKPKFELDGDGVVLAHSPERYEDYLHSWLYDMVLIRFGPRLGIWPPSGIDLTRGLLLAMKEESRKLGAEFVVLNWNWSNEDRSLDAANIADEIAIVDAATNAPEGWGGKEFLLGSHPNGKACAHAAGLLVNHIIDNKLLTVTTTTAG